jgi:hypothetical protein
LKRGAISKGAIQMNGAVGRRYGLASRRIRSTPAAVSLDGAMLMIRLLLTGVLLRSALLLIETKTFASGK